MRDYDEFQTINEVRTMLIMEAGPTTAKVKRLIKKAIANQRELRIFYVSPERDTANPNGWRIIQPHAFGFSGSGAMLLRAWHLNADRGFSFSHSKPLWRLFRTDGVVRVELLQTTFKQRPDYKKGDKTMRGGIIAEL